MSRNAFAALLVAAIAVCGCQAPSASSDAHPLAAAMRQGLAEYSELLEVVFCDAAVAIVDGAIKDERGLKDFLSRRSAEARSVAFQPVFDQMHTFMSANRESGDFKKYASLACMHLINGCVPTDR